MKQAMEQVGVSRRLEWIGQKTQGFTVPRYHDQHSGLWNPAIRVLFFFLFISKKFADQIIINSKL